MSGKIVVINYQYMDPSLEFKKYMVFLPLFLSVVTEFKPDELVSQNQNFLGQIKSKST